MQLSELLDRKEGRITLSIHNQQCTPVSTSPFHFGQYPGRRQGPAVSGAGAPCYLGVISSSPPEVTDTDNQNGVLFACQQKTLSSFSSSFPAVWPGGKQRPLGNPWDGAGSCLTTISTQASQFTLLCLRLCFCKTRHRSLLLKAAAGMRQVSGTKVCEQ